MYYELRHFDTPLIRFTATENSNSPNINIVWLDENSRHLFPMDMNVSEDGLETWLKHRTIPRNRAYVHNFLSKCGLNINRPMNIISVSKGLSLNDCYWVVEKGFSGTFDKYNLYENNLSRILALIAFTGYGSNQRTSLASCPEFTTNGMLPKCWRRIDGKIKLYKGGTSGASNTGREPYCEYYAAQIANVLGINAVSYNISKWKKQICSSCELFTSKELSFLPVGKLVTHGGWEAVYKYYDKLGQKYSDALHDMLVFDAVIYNTDRHFGNFGFLIDSRKNVIVAPAPLFDHGNSLFNYAGEEDFASDTALAAYADTLMPCVYDDFINAAQEVLTQRHREGLRRLLQFKFKLHSSYNLPKKHLLRIQNQIQVRARILLGE